MTDPDAHPDEFSVIGILRRELQRPAPDPTNRTISLVDERGASLQALIEARMDAKDRADIILAGATDQPRNATAAR